MKYILSTMTLLLAIVGFSNVSYAQTPKPVTPVVQPPAPTLFDAQTNAPLAVRKQTVETNLRGVATTLNTMYTRIQVASNRLRINGIDTTASDAKLAVAQTALLSAKTSLDAFSNTVVDEKPATVTILRTHAKAAEDHLRTARTSIIDGIALLQITLSNQ